MAKSDVRTEHMCIKISIHMSTTWDAWLKTIEMHKHRFLIVERDGERIVCEYMSYNRFDCPLKSEYKQTKEIV